MNSNRNINIQMPNFTNLRLKKYNTIYYWFFIKLQETIYCKVLVKKDFVEITGMFLSVCVFRYCEIFKTYKDIFKMHTLNIL